MTITQGAPADGVLADPDAATDGGSVSGSTMTLRGTAAQVTAELRALVFTPTAHQVAPGDAVTTGFILAVTDTAGASASDGSTSVIATATETPPAIGGTTAGQAMTDQQTLHPFAVATITDPDAGASVTTTITVAANGAAGTLGGAGLTRTGAGTYVLAAASPAEEQAALRAVLFTPGTGTPGSTVTNALALQVSDGTDVATDATTSVLATRALTGTAMGDVHMVTLDGLPYDFQADGEFTLVRSTTPGTPFDIQIRTEAWAAHGLTSLVTGVAAQVGTGVVAFALNGAVTVNGLRDTALDGAHPVQQIEGGTLTALGGGGYQLDWAGGEGLTVTNEGFYLDLHATVAAGDGPGSVQGLLGSLRGQADDLALPDGTVLAQPVPDAQMLGTFAQAWAVGGTTSMLDGGAPVIRAASLGLPDHPSFVTASAPGQVLTGSLGGTDPVIVAGTLADLDGAIVTGLALRDAMDVTDAAFPGLELSYARSATGGALTIREGTASSHLAIAGVATSAGVQAVSDLHGGTLIRFGQQSA